MKVSDFDTLDWAKRLEKSGYSFEQARAIVGVVAKTFVFTNGQLVCTVEERQIEIATMALEQIERMKLDSDLGMEMH